MRFSVSRWFEECHNVGDRKTITKFLIFPKIINEEFRWLERVTFEQEYTWDYPDGEYWTNIRWVD